MHVRPGVNGQLVTLHVLRLQHLRPGDSPGPNDEEGTLDVLRGEEGEESRRVRRWSVVWEMKGGQSCAWRNPGTGD